MIKLIKTILFSFLVFSITSCSYNPIYSQKNNKFTITELNLVGDKNVNSIIKRKINVNKKDSNSKKYIVSLNTIKEKRIVSKDEKGDPLKFEILIETIYKINDEEKLVTEKSVKKTNIYNNLSDKFKLEQSEKIIIENLSEKIAENIISTITNLDDY